MLLAKIAVPPAPFLVSCMLYLLFPFPTLLPLVPRLAVSLGTHEWKSSVMAGGEAAGWSRWYSDTSQMLLLQLLIRTPSNMVRHTPELLKDWGGGGMWGQRGECFTVLSPMMTDPNTTAGSCIGRPVVEKISDNLSQNHGWYTVCFPLITAVLKPSALQMVNVQWRMVLNPCIRYNYCVTWSWQQNHMTSLDHLGPFSFMIS